VVINIWPGVAPGSEQWKQKETTLVSGPMQTIVNVTTPTLTAYMPDPAKATSTAVIITPAEALSSSARIPTKLRSGSRPVALRDSS
jgi:hypothetical protein